MDNKTCTSLYCRWAANIYRRTAAGLVNFQHDIEELEELQDIVEGGPDWRTIDRIEIRLARSNTQDLTIEQAMILAKVPVRYQL